MLNFLTLILLCQLLGELIVIGLNLPLPGPVIGMAALFLILAYRGSVPDNLAIVGDNLLRHLSLLFVPAGVGVMLHFPLIGKDWPALGAALIISTLLTIAITAWIMTRFSKSKPDPS